MLTFQLYDELNKVLTAISKAEYLNDSIDKITKQYSPLIQHLQETTININKPPTPLRNFLTQAQVQVRQIKIRKLFKDIDYMQDILKSIKLDNANINIDQTLHHLETFAEAFESFVDNKTPQSSIKLITETELLKTYLNGLTQGITLFTNNYIVEPENIQNTQELSIILSSKMTLSEFILKLKTIENLYEELCLLLKVNLNDHPIEILKIESGSMWTKLIGDTKVIKFLKKILESGAYYIYTNHTNAGKISIIPKKVDSIDSILKLRENLDKQGIETEELDEQLKKSSILIAKNLNSLLENESNIIIDDTRVSIDGDNNQYVEYKKPLSIEHNIDTNTDEK